MEREGYVRFRCPPMAFEMAYQARVAIDRIRFAIKATEQFAHGSQLLQEVNMQLLDALNRLESAELGFQRGFRSEPVGGQFGEVALGSNGSEIDRKPGVRR